MAATEAMGEGLEGSSLVEQAVAIRSTATIGRVLSGIDRFTSSPRNCCEAKLFRLPAVATHSAPFRAGFIIPLGKTERWIDYSFRLNGFNPHPNPLTHMERGKLHRSARDGAG